MCRSTRLFFIPLDCLSCLVLSTKRDTSSSLEVQNIDELFPTTNKRKQNFLPIPMYIYVCMCVYLPVNVWFSSQGYIQCEMWNTSNLILFPLTSTFLFCTINGKQLLSDKVSNRPTNHSDNVEHLHSLWLTTAVHFDILGDFNLEDYCYCFSTWNFSYCLLSNRAQRLWWCR